MAASVEFGSWVALWTELLNWFLKKVNDEAKSIAEVNLKVAFGFLVMFLVKSLLNVVNSCFLILFVIGWGKGNFY